jgi:hypothetical protein
MVLVGRSFRFDGSAVGQAFVSGTVVVILAAAIVVAFGASGWFAVPTSIAAIALWLWSRHATLDEQAWRRLGVATLLVFIATSFAWAIAFDSMQGSDFGVYYRCGIEKHASLEARLASCQSKFLLPSTIYWRRSLFYTIPFGALFGDNYFALKLYNAGLHAIALAGMLYGMRRWAHPAIAFAALVLFAIHPENWYALTLAAPDHVAVLVVMAFLLVLPKLDSTRWLLSAIVLAGLMFVAEQVRTIGLLLSTSVVIFALTAEAGLWTRLRRAALVVMIYIVCSTMLREFLPRYPDLTVSPLQILSTLDFSGTQSWASSYLWGQLVWPTIPEEHHFTISLNRFALEFANNFALFPKYLYAKLAILFSGNGYFNFASRDLTDNIDTVFTVARSTPPSAAWLIMVLPGILLVILLAAISGALRGTGDMLTRAAMSWFATFVVFVIALGESQSRYSALISPATAIIGANAIRARPQGRPIFRGALVALILSLGAMVLLFAIGLGIATLLRATMPQPLAAASLTAISRSGSATCDPSRVLLQRTHQQARLTFLPEAHCAIMLIPVPPTWRSIGIVVTRDDLGYLYQTIPPSPFRYAFGAGAESAGTATLDRKIAAWHQIDLAPNQSALELLIEKDGNSAGSFIVIAPVKIR